VLESTQRLVLPESMSFPEIPKSHLEMRFFSFTEFQPSWADVFRTHAP